MRKSRYTESQIYGILAEQKTGKTVAEISREHGITAATFYRWKSKYGGMELSELKRVKELELENAKLKKLYADRSLEVEALKDVLSKKW